ncbi:sce7726 family protein [Celerinatantimonas sp. MCCC 1A17872]|uniref:sce7726 family protein n=1 Tax=Celerinatantimonas sp. MCCC 1A17872 TaxID=3177514 RepID=UPI0038C29227
MKEIQIKTRLVEYLLQIDSKLSLGAEVPFQFGSRRADIISLSGDIATAFEIKGAEDTVMRLDYQINSYKNYFDYCFVVCEDSNLNQVRKAIGKEIGIIVITEKSVKEIRKSARFKRLNKISLASTLAISDLRKIIKDNRIRAKHDLCEKLANNYSLNEIKKISRESLLYRYKKVSELLKIDKGEKLNPDDILIITRMPPEPLFTKSKINSCMDIINHTN